MANSNSSPRGKMNVSDLLRHMGEPAAVFQYMSELIFAGMRIGDTSEKAIGWLLRFAKSDLSTLSGGDWRNLQYELTHFRINGFPNDNKLLAITKGEQLVSGYDFRGRTNPEETLISREEVASFQTLLKETLDAILRRTSLGFRFTSIQRTLTFCRRDFDQMEEGKDSRANWALRTTAQDPKEALSYAMLDLLKDCADFIRECPEFANSGCQKIFFAERSNRDFCSVKCQSRAATRRYRSEHGLSSGRPRGRPRKAPATKSRPADENPANIQRRRPHGKSKREGPRRPPKEGT